MAERGMEAPPVRRKRWGPPVADTGESPPKLQASTSELTGRKHETTDVGRNNTDLSTSERALHITGSGTKSTTSVATKRKRKSRWDLPGGTTNQPSPDTGTRQVVLSVSVEATHHQSLGNTNVAMVNVVLDARDTDAPVESSTGHLLLPGGVLAKLPTPLLCERDAPLGCSEEVKLAFTDLARVNAAALAGSSRDDDDACVSPRTRRSPSPEPIYGKDGQRLNTRERLAAEKIKQQRCTIIEKIKHLSGDAWRPPLDYKPPVISEKIIIPIADHPGYNFFGLIIGPRGNTQKQMQRDTNTRIVIRGKGSAKLTDSFQTNYSAQGDENEPMHVLISGDNKKDVDAAVLLVNNLLEPLGDDENTHKKNQLRELAVLNGTLREHISDGSILGSGKGNGEGDASANNSDILPPEIRERVEAQYKKDVAAVAGVAMEDKKEEDQAYMEFLSEIGAPVGDAAATTEGQLQTNYSMPQNNSNFTNDSAKLYVGKLPSYACVETVHLTFAVFGPITKVDVVPDRERNLPCRGFAFVQFMDEAVARRAATLTNAKPFPHPLPLGFPLEFCRAPRAMEVRVKSDPRPEPMSDQTGVPYVPVVDSTSPPMPPPTPLDPNAKLYLAKLPVTWTSEDLRIAIANVCANADNIVSCDMVFDRDTGASRGFGFARVSDSQIAQKVIQKLDGTRVDGRRLVVRIATETNVNHTASYGKSQSYPPGQYAGGYYPGGYPQYPTGYYTHTHNPYGVPYDPVAVAAAEAAVTAANPELAAAAAAEIVRASGVGIQMGDPHGAPPPPPP